MFDAERLILTDANILIDYSSAGLEILQLVSEHLAQVVVPDVVFQEVRNRGVLSRRQARAIAQRIHQLNPHSITVIILDRFLDRIR